VGFGGVTCAALSIAAAALGKVIPKICAMLLADGSCTGVSVNLTLQVCVRGLMPITTTLRGVPFLKGAGWGWGPLSRDGQ
jgi:hypothetical protein